MMALAGQQRHSTSSLGVQDSVAKISPPQPRYDFCNVRPSTHIRTCAIVLECWSDPPQRTECALCVCQVAQVLRTVRRQFTVEQSGRGPLCVVRMVRTTVRQMAKVSVTDENEDQTGEEHQPRAAL